MLPLDSTGDEHFSKLALTSKGGGPSSTFEYVCLLTNSCWSYLPTVIKAEEFHLVDLSAEPQYYLSVGLWSVIELHFLEGRERQFSHVIS